MGRKLTASKDINPQMMRMQVVESAANTFTEANFATPSLLEAGYVMEILRITTALESIPDISGGDRYEVAIYDRTKSAIPAHSDDGVLVSYKRHIGLATQGGSEFGSVHIWEFTDGAGNGLLYAGKRLYIAVLGESQTNPQTIGAQILYRLKKTSVEEIIGLTNI